MSEPHYTQTASLKDGHSKGITSVVFNSDGSLLATAGLDGTACVWDTKNWQLVDIYYAKTAITSLVWFSNDALICGLEDGVLSSLTKDGEGLIHVSGFWAHHYPIEHLSVSTETDLVASGAHSELSVWHWQTNPATSCLIKSISPPRQSEEATSDDSQDSDAVNEEVLVTGVSWTPGILIVTYMKHGIRFIETETWKTVRVIESRYPLLSSSLCPTGYSLAACTLSSGFVIVDLEAGTITRKFKHKLGEEQRALPVSFIHGGNAIVGGSAVGYVNIWIVSSEHRLPPLHIPNEEKVFALAGHYDAPKDRFLIATGIMNEHDSSNTIIWTLEPSPISNDVKDEHPSAENVEEVTESSRTNGDFIHSILYPALAILGLVLAALAYVIFVDHEDLEEGGVEIRL